MAYSDKVIDHYENPRNVGVLDKDAVNVGTGMVGAGLVEAPIECFVDGINALAEKMS